MRLQISRYTSCQLSFNSMEELQQQAHIQYLISLSSVVPSCLEEDESNIRYSKCPKKEPINKDRSMYFLARSTVVNETYM